MIRILFVDNGPQAFTEVKRALADSCPDWNLAFAGTGEKAVELLAGAAFDVMVAYANLPGMAGTALLAHVADHHPDCVRILLSEHANPAAMPQLVGPAHQYLSKPCNPEVLAEAVQRAFILRQLLTDDKLKRLVSKIQSLPMVPAVYNEILRELQNEDPSVSHLGNLIAKDLGICTKLLQLVNSPYFGLPEQVTNPAQAILYLGVNTVKQLLLAVGIVAEFESKTKTVSFDQLWSHSWATGTLAKSLVESELADAYLADQAFLSGLLHDVGKLVLATGLAEEYPNVIQHHRRSRKPLWTAELELLGATHAEVGACLLGLWGMPTPLVEAVASHHRPVNNGQLTFGLVTALHVANCLQHEKEPGGIGVVQSQMDMAYLTALRMQDRVRLWRRHLAESPFRQAV